MNGKKCELWSVCPLWYLLPATSAVAVLRPSLFRQLPSPEQGPYKKGKIPFGIFALRKGSHDEATEKKILGGGNKDPNTRMAFPDVDMDTFVDKLDGYVRQMGAKEAFNLYNYANMEPQQAESAKSLRKLHKLLEACVATSPEAKIKYKHLKGALQTLQQRFGQELLSATAQTCF